eukprot:CAMPEP_0183746268 /NCGR_PEP_ID=MMETSP0737-20130205/66667_1 /TAXON_ID=385413 /ORGANISM="Thalassiosira miniscula, Strain CCMP1093" /LENGTH=667 /DNA_ID=CAMNT_0025981957 /DNA_START=1 /DNA_END=2004 /DNA_ORIENTATION=+
MTMMKWRGNGRSPTENVQSNQAPATQQDLAEETSGSERCNAIVGEDQRSFGGGGEESERSLFQQLFSWNPIQCNLMRSSNDADNTNAAVDVGDEGQESNSLISTKECPSAEDNLERSQQITEAKQSASARPGQSQKDSNAKGEQVRPEVTEVAVLSSKTGKKDVVGASASNKYDIRGKFFRKKPRKERRQKKGNGMEKSPKATTSPPKATSDNTEWKVAMDGKTSKPYYYNRKTNEVTWSKPPELMEGMGDRREKKSDDGKLAWEHHQSESSKNGVSERTDTKKYDKQQFGRKETAQSTKERDHIKNSVVVQNNKGEAIADEKDATEEDGKVGQSWKVALDGKTSKPYYYNTITKEVSWAKPQNFVERINEQGEKDHREMKQRRTRSDLMGNAAMQTREPAAASQRQQQQDCTNGVRGNFREGVSSNAIGTHYSGIPILEHCIDKVESLSKKTANATLNKSKGRQTGNQQNASFKNRTSSLRRKFTRSSSIKEQQLASSTNEAGAGGKDKENNHGAAGCVHNDEGKTSHNTGVKENEGHANYWRVAHDKNTSKPYYYNRKTNEVSWSRPTELSEGAVATGGGNGAGSPNKMPALDTSTVHAETQRTAKEIPSADNGMAVGKADKRSNIGDMANYWRETLDATTGKTYYYNKKTKMVSWTKPSSTIKN